MFGLFGWIRTRARDSLLAGIADAVGELAKGEVNGEGEAIATLRLTLATPPAALPAPEPTPEAPARRGRKE